MQTLFAFTVGQLNRYLKDLLSLDDMLSGFWLRGEASNVTRHASGHLYFTLKDADGQVSCAMWKPDTFRLRCPVEAGAQYLAYGKMTLWEKRGSLQFIAEHLEPDGVGALHVAYERLKARLSAEGLFDDERKRPLPFLPQRIGLVTSPTGAAVRDMVRILRERHPRLDIVIVPALVQGDAAPESIARAIADACRLGLDLLIVGRGGGSLEDLWAFNDERVVRAVAGCAVPVISAVGHETDVTLADFAADLRASTPTAAAQSAVPLTDELRERTLLLLEAATVAIERRMAEERRRVRRCLDRAAFLHPAEIAMRRRKETDRLVARLGVAAKDLLLFRRQRAAAAIGRLDALSPLGVISRGYALVRSEGRLVRSVEDAPPGRMVEARLADGTLRCEVKSAEKTEASAEWAAPLARDKE
jgi:exodeoxyribonuclease VII large subunit